MSIEDMRNQLLSAINDTTEAQEATVQNNSNPHTGIEPDSFDGFEPVELPEYVYGNTEPIKEEETLKGKSEGERSGHVDLQAADKAGQNRTKQDRGILSCSDKLHKYGFFSSTDFYNDINPVEYLIDNVIQRNAYHMIFGPSENGKSFVALDIAEHIAYAGNNEDFNQWYEKPVEHGDVIYFTGEGSNGMKKRHRLWCQLHGVDPDETRIFFMPASFALDEKGMSEKIIAAVKDIGLNPVLIVFDTLNRYMTGDENSNTDAAVFNAACAKLNSQLNAAVIVVHHSGKGEETKKQSRGASAFRGALDIELYVTKNESDVITLQQTKNKDGRKEPTLLFNLTEYAIRGVDDNGNTKDENGEYILQRDKYGKPITSCVIFPAVELMKQAAKRESEKRAKKEEKATKPKYTKAQRFAFSSYYMAAAEHGEIVVDNEQTGHAVIRVDIEDWRKVFKEKSSIHNEDKRKEEEAKRRAFNRAIQFFTEPESEDISAQGMATIQRIDGNDYCIVDLSNDAFPADYRKQIQTVIKQREQPPQEEITEYKQSDGSVVRVCNHKGLYMENGYPQDGFTAEHISPTGERTQLTEEPISRQYFDPCLGVSEEVTQAWLKRAKERQSATAGSETFVEDTSSESKEETPKDN